jgi:two-component system, response regulator, stage 0 sporulation protein F
MEFLNYMTVLYVDDEPINLELFKLIFRRSFHVILAESGAEALAILENTREINIVISDLKMPNMSGLEFIQKAAKLNQSLLFFLLSGYSITEDINKHIHSGLIKKYFQKPFNKTEIMSAFKEYLGV